MILSGSLVGNHILVAKPILALSQIGGLGVVWGVCGGESRGVSVGMSGVGRSGRGVSLCALGIFGGSGRGLRVVLGVEKGSGGCQVCPCVWHHTHSRQSPDPQFVKGLKWVWPQEYGFPPDYWTESHKQYTKLKLMHRSTT